MMPKPRKNFGDRQVFSRGIRKRWQLGWEQGGHVSFAVTLATGDSDVTRAGWGRVLKAAPTGFADRGCEREKGASGRLGGFWPEQL